MAKLTIAQEIELMLSAGAVKITSFVDKDGKPLAVRSMELTTDPLEVGDVLNIPVTFDIIKVGFTKDAEDKDKYPCILVELTSSDGSQRNFRFFPNSLRKSITPIVNDVRQARVKTTGTATELFGQYATVDEGMNALKGRKIRVAAAEPYTIKDYTTKELKTTHIYRYDLV